MAVTMFLRGEQTYAEFEASLMDLAASHPEVLFVVKTHPLSKTETLSEGPNVIVADRDDNVHALIDATNATLCYNSGAGLLSILHGKPTITLGNAFYNIANAGFRASSAHAGVVELKYGTVVKPATDIIIPIAAWLMLRRYSRFSAVDQIVELQTRMSHRYKDISVSEFRWKDVLV